MRCDKCHRKVRPKCYVEVSGENLCFVCCPDHALPSQTSLKKVLRHHPHIDEKRFADVWNRSDSNIEVANLMCLDVRQVQTKANSMRHRGIFLKRHKTRIASERT